MIDDRGISSNIRYQNHSKQKIANDRENHVKCRDLWTWDRNHAFYTLLNYKISSLCLMNEVERYEKIRKNAYALIKDFKDTSDSNDEPNGEIELPPEMLE